ncbi:MAG TPA: hypothetical protein PLJ60_10085 [Chryseolinea sp.]|nr:hypothetical protein [Chryseolinea sp.]HPH45980.1 hypothetical protein [Chryseolinea sp.]HPM30672.1 hypothetical protein [Chryseolinea sp.]
MSKYFFAGIFIMMVYPLAAQVVNERDDESKLYAQSKQVNQFFRRFNGEESEKGDRYYPGDKQYRSEKLRKKYLATLFDENNNGMSAALKVEFAKYVLDKDELSILEFKGSNWFSEVQTLFTLNGKEEVITLYMELEKDHLGYKWVISRIQSKLFDPYFQHDTTKVGRFLHPLSHELDFMNLRKAFIPSDSITQYTSRKFKADQLTVFLYEVKKGNLKFKSVQNVKFHFFQLDGWYFELAQFNRTGYNTGWLISNLVKLNSDAEKKLMLSYLYN